MPEDNHLAYARLFKHLAHGWGLYNNAGSNRLLPGVLGYFDRDGEWTFIGPINTLQVIHGGYTRFGTLASAHGMFNETRAALGAGGGAVGIPVDVEASYNFYGSQQLSAFCLPERVKESRVSNPWEIHRWMLHNAGWMLDQHALDVDRNGIWVVTKTSVSPKCAKAVKQAGETGFLAGVKLRGGDVANADLSGASWRGDMSTTSYIHDYRDDAGVEVVVFFRGVRFTRMWRWAKDELREDKDPDKLSKSRVKLLAKKGSPKRRTANDGVDPAGDPAGGSWSYTLVAKDGYTYQLEYELWGDELDPFMFDLDSIDSASDSPRVTASQQQTTNVQAGSKTVQSSDWIWSPQYGKYYRVEDVEGRPKKYIWAA